MERTYTMSGNEEITRAFENITPQDIIGAGSVAVGETAEKPFGVDLMTIASPADRVFSQRGTGTHTYDFAPNSAIGSGRSDRNEDD